MSVFNGIKLKGIDKDGQEKEFSLDNFTGTVVLYFYPKDNTSGCTKEACDFRDNFNRLTGKATVIGVSPDSIESHKKFQQGHSLNFILLSDPKHELAEKFGVWQDRIKRSTFIIKDGLITKAWKDVKVEGHVDDVISSL